MTTVNPTKQLRQQNNFNLLKTKIQLLRFKDGIMFYENEKFPLLPDGVLNRELCKLFLEYKEELKTNIVLSSMLGKYHERNHGSSIKMSKEKLIEHYFPQDCSLLTRRIIETAVNKKKAPTFYEYLFYKKQRVLILQLNNGLIKETYKYRKLFNCESEVKKVLNVFSKREPQTKKKSIGRSSSLKQGKTVKEMVNSTQLTRTNSSQNLTRSGIRMGYLGKKRSKRGRRKTK